MSALDSSSTAELMKQLRCLQGDFETRKACRKACTVDTCPLVLSYWGYRPHIPTNAAFAAVFAIFMAIVLVQGVWTRRFKKYTAMMFVGSAMEIIGYISRIYAYSYPFSDVAFISQLTTLTLAPTFYAAAIYFSLQKIVLTFGAEYSRIPPRLIPRIFITCDIISIVLQGGGGAYAAYLAQKEKMPDNGNYTMIGGLSFQALTLLVFLSLSADFAVRVILTVRRHGGAGLNEDLASRRLRSSKRFRCLLASLTIAAVFIFVRSVYRVAELAQGWKGELMSTEKFVIMLEGIPVAISGFLLSVFHPAVCFPEEKYHPESMEIPDTPPAAQAPSAGSHGSMSEAEKYNSQYGNVTVTYDPTFDRKHYR